MIEQYSRVRPCSCRGGRLAAAGRPRDREVGACDGAVPHGRPCRQRRGLVHPQAALCGKARHDLVREVADKPLRTGPLRSEDRRRLVQATSPASAIRLSIRSSTSWSRITARSIGITPRKISDDEIVHRCMFALVNEGARILEEGIALRASDIDMIYLTGYGFPRIAAGRCCTPTRSGCTTSCNRMNDFAAGRENERRCRLLETRAAAGEAGGRRQGLQRLSPRTSSPGVAERAAGRDLGRSPRNSKKGT
jgi:hypothetical protein